MNEQPTDQTGYGYSSGGFAPTPADSAAARRNKYEMDRMSDFMQKLDPVLNRTMETLIRTQVRNGASPEEARRAAFGSVSGQAMSDTMLGLRRTGFLGKGDPIATGRNYLQGVAGGGFTMDVLNSGGRSAGMNQSVMGGGMLAGQASMQLAKDVMGNIYGEGGSDPARAYGHDMQGTSQVFRKLAERGALGKIGTLHQYGDNATSPDAVNEKLANAKRQEVDPLIKAALEGTDAENIDDKIAEALKRGDKQVATALKEIKASKSSFVLDDANTKRVADITKETLQGLSNLKDIYGELNNPQLLAQMEALTGISISNKSEARKAANMVQSITNTAEATGNDPRAVMGMMLARQGNLQANIANQFGAEMGQGGAAGGLGKELTGAMNKSITEYALTAEASGRDTSTRAGTQFGVSLTDINKEDMIADTETQMLKWTDQNRDIVMMSGQGQTSLKNDVDFQKKRRSIEERMARAKDDNERSSLNSEARRLNMSRNNGMGADEMLQTDQGRATFGKADWDTIGGLAGANSAMSVRNDRSDQVIKDVGFEGKQFDSISTAFKRMGVSGMSLLAGEDGKLKSGDALKAELDKMIENGTLSMDEADSVGAYAAKATDAQYAENVQSVGSSTARGQSFHDTQIATVETEARKNKQQHSIYSDEKGLSLKKVINAVLDDPKDGSLNTTTKQLYALEAMQKSGLAKNLKPSAEVNWDDGLSKEEMDKIRKTTGDENYSIHKQLGFNSEDDMLAASEGQGGAKVRAAMQRELNANTDIFSGGSSDATMYAASDQAEDIRKATSNYELAIKYGDLMGVERGGTSPAMREIAETGELSEGGITKKFGADGKQALYDENGRNYGNILRTFTGGALDKVHLSKAGNYKSLADRTNSKEEGEDMIRLNNLSGGSMLEGMEEQLAVTKEAQRSGAKVIDTTDDKGVGIKQDISENIAAMTAAIAKMKADDGKGVSVTKRMEVDVLVINRQEKK